MPGIGSVSCEMAVFEHLRILIRQTLFWRRKANSRILSLESLKIAHVVEIIIDSPIHKTTTFIQL